MHVKGLYRDGILKFLNFHGYAKRYRNKQNYYFIKEELSVIEEVSSSNILDHVLAYIDSMDEIVEGKVAGHAFAESKELLKEIFLRQDHLIFNQSYLEHLPVHDKPILRDDKENIYLAFTNVIICINKGGIKVIEYDKLKDHCIWENQIINFNFNYSQGNADCHFTIFINNVANQDPLRIAAFQSAIGYLCHNYNEPSKGQALLLYDEDIIDLRTPMGGTGKGVFVKAVKTVRQTVKVDGKKFEADDKFCFQQIDESTQVVWFDDVKPNLDFDRFNSILTDGWNIEKKRKHEFHIPHEEGPKVVIASNSIIDGEGTTRKRRQIIIEFGNHYSQKIKEGNEEPIVEEHGCTFFSDDWDDNEWQKFYSYIADCCLLYLKEGIISYRSNSFAQNKLRLTVSEDFYDWVQYQSFEPGITYEIQPFYQDFKSRYFPQDDYKQRSFTNQVKKYGKAMGWKYVNKTSNGVSKFIFKEN